MIKTTRFPSRIRRSRGFTLVELMVGITLGLMVLSAVTLVFVNASNGRREMERVGRQIENGRYAISLLRDDFSTAGYFGEFDPRLVPVPAALPDPCETDPAALKASLRIHLQGYDLPAAVPGCLSAANVKNGTDVVVIRRVSTCVAGTAGCDAAVNNRIYLQSSLCNEELALPTVDQRFVVSNKLADFNLHKRSANNAPCNTAAAADLRRFRVHLYFIANDNRPGDGIPTLKRAELGTGAYTVAPLVEGIENLQVEYGVDTDGDGIPNAFTANPAGFSYPGCVAPCVAVWSNIVAVRMHLIARNSEATPGYQDTKVYALGLDADGNEQTLGPTNDQFKRHAYTTTVRVNNPAGRRE